MPYSKIFSIEMALGLVIVAVIANAMFCFVGILANLAYNLLRGRAGAGGRALAVATAGAGWLSLRRALAGAGGKDGRA